MSPFQTATLWAGRSTWNISGTKDTSCVFHVEQRNFVEAGEFHSAGKQNSVCST